MFKPKSAMIWADNVRRYREHYMISQNELAKKIKRSKMSVSRYEEGVIPDPKIIDLIAKTFRVEVHELFLPADRKNWPERKVAIIG